MFYKLRHRKPIKCTSTEFAFAFENFKRRRIRLTKFKDGRILSTVFLCLDHGIDESKPVLFETAIRNKLDDWQVLDRACTHRQALKMHRLWKAKLVLAQSHKKA